ncbi:SWIM zinc finger family protein [Granulicoccus sp. GXG6511]|uniref:SWIM zinc finger family protein n=1 Tax=Granulicoccus sp. GXG6511 TaxID=3381351 RepID=UPI003D7D1821
MGHESARWTIERVMAAAPDSASAIAGRKLATAGPWSGVGQDGPVLWGQCRGSAREAYQVLIDTAGPRYKCSCPSRKFPCKHVLGLLFRWAEGRLADDGLPGLEVGTPQVAAEPTAPRGAAEPAKAAAARARAEERDARVAAGLLELQQWLADRMADGLGRWATAPARWEEMAARMVDAQAPGVARTLRRLAALPPGADLWAEEVLAELGLLDLLARAFAQRAALPEDFLATVRSHLGFTVGKADVLRLPPVADRWSVFGLHDSQDDERVATRRVWLRGRETGRFAVVLLFSINGGPYEMTVAPGMELDADLHFYPGRPPLRALIGNRRAERELTLDLVVDPAAATVAAARDAWARALADDPWLNVWPAVVRGRLTAGPVGDTVEFQLVGEDGDAVALRGPESLRWRAIAVTGGEPMTWFGELRRDGLNVLSFVDPVRTHGELVVL